MTADFLTDHQDAMRKAARAGYAARGAVFLIVGYFAFRAAFAAGRAMSMKDAVDTIAGSIFGTALLALLVLSLAAFTAWRLIQVFFDVDRHGTDAKGLFVRAGLLVSAFAYGGLAAYAASILFGLGSGSGGGGADSVIAAAYEAGYGRWLTLAVAVGMAAAGVAHLVKGFKAGFEKFMNIPGRIETWLKPLCQFGLIARGVTFFVLAGLLFTGVVSYTAGSKPGLETALREVSSWSFGWVLLSVIGAGLMAFGLYAVAEAIYRRVRVEPVA